MLAAVAGVFAAGADVDWRAFFPGARRVELPTYAFQHQRYWLEVPAGSGDAASMGLTAGDHPLLGAAVSLAGNTDVVLTGRLSLRAQPWLARAPHRGHPARAEHGLRRTRRPRRGPGRLR